MRFPVTAQYYMMRLRSHWRRKFARPPRYESVDINTLDEQPIIIKSATQDHQGITFQYALNRADIKVHAGEIIWRTLFVPHPMILKEDRDELQSIHRAIIKRTLRIDDERWREQQQKCKIA